MLYGFQLHSSHQCLPFQCFPFPETKVEHVAFFLRWTVLEHCKTHQKRTEMHRNTPKCTKNAMELTYPYLRLRKMHWTV